MIKKCLLFFTCSIIFCLCSCGPIDYFGHDYELEGVEIILEGEKSSFGIGETVNLLLSFDADFDTFNRYDFAMTVYKDSNRASDVLQIIDAETGDRCENKMLVFKKDADIGNVKVSKRYIIKTTQEGEFYISAFFVGTKKADPNNNYISRKYVPISVKN